MGGGLVLETLLKKLHFRFNSAARREAIAALKKLGNWGSVLSPVFGYLFGGTFQEKVAIAIGAAALFIVCHAIAIYVAGLEAEKKRLEEAEADKSPKDR